MSAMKSRVKVKVTGFGDNHRCTVLGQVKIGFFYETIYQRELLNGNTIGYLIDQAKMKIEQFKASGLDENGELEV